MRVLVTRPQPQADQWVAQLAALGIEATALPLLVIAPPADAQGVRDAWAALPHQGLVMFVSPSAVERFFALADHGAAWPHKVIAAGTGPGTERALRAAGVPAACVVCPPPDSARFDSESLWPLLQRRRAWRGASALIVRGEGGREWLADALRQQGAIVSFVEAYRRLPPSADASTQQCVADALALPERHVWTFSSSEAVRHLPLLAPQADWSGSVALGTHPRIVQAAVELGFGRVEAVAATPQAVADWVADQATRSIQSRRS